MPPLLVTSLYENAVVLANYPWDAFMCAMLHHHPLIIPMLSISPAKLISVQVIAKPVSQPILSLLGSMLG